MEATEAAVEMTALPAPEPEIAAVSGADVEDIFGDMGGDFPWDTPLSADAGTADFEADIEAAFATLEAPETVAAELVDVPADTGLMQLDAPVDADLADAADVEHADGDAADALAAAATAAEPAWWLPEGITFNYSSQSSAQIVADFLDMFIEEGATEVERLEDAVGAWERDVAAEALYTEVNRILHTVKGIGKSVGLHRFGTLVHNFESLLAGMPRPAPGAEQDYFRIVNVWLDAVVRGIAHITEQREDVASELPAMAPAAVTAAAAPIAESPVAEDTVAEIPVAEGPVGESLPAEMPVAAAVAVDAAAADLPASPSAAVTLVTDDAANRRRERRRAEEAARNLAAQQSVRITSEKLDHLLNLASQSQQLCVRASQSTNRGKRSTAELQTRLSSVRAEIANIADRALLTVSARGTRRQPGLDALEMDQYSELQEAASILREGVEDLADLVEVLSRQNAQVEALLKQQSAVISSISSSVQAARLVPVSRLMPGLRRIVRTVGNDLGKQVNFRVLNEIGALDRDHHARLQVALEHMLRNALDHGIEPSDERTAAGKPAAGTISIDVRKSGGDYIVRLSDDGRGMDPQRLRESARSKSIPVDVDALDDAAALRLIFYKGFSTASTISEISGRGVGMDIVLTELQHIGGDIEIHSVVGSGTTFEVRIPSNVTVHGALLVTAAEHSYAVPLNGLIAVDQVPVAEYFDAVAQGRSLRLFDSDCEPAYLGTLCHGLGLPDRNVWGSYVPVIIAGSDERRMAIAIDNLKEALELVVRSLGVQFASVPGLAGAATTAEGEAIVALDLNLLVSSADADGVAPVAVSHAAQDTRLLALVVDDSRTQRTVATSQLDSVGVESVTAENGMVAIDFLNSAHRLPDVVLMDVEMPVKDGIETLREIRKSRRYRHLPVIMVTSRTGAKHRAMAKEAGCNAYMGKPFNFPALLEQINQLTGRNLQAPT